MSESLENFTNIVKEDIKEAKTLFFSEAFKEEYLKDRREEKELYHQLLLGLGFRLAAQGGQRFRPA